MISLGGLPLIGFLFSPNSAHYGVLVAVVLRLSEGGVAEVAAGGFTVVS